MVDLVGGFAAGKSMADMGVNFIGVSPGFFGDIGIKKKVCKGMKGLIFIHVGMHLVYKRADAGTIGVDETQVGLA
jgi:hypothetical protein